MNKTDEALFHDTYSSSRRDQHQRNEYLMCHVDVSPMEKSKAEGGTGSDNDKYGVGGDDIFYESGSGKWHLNRELQRMGTVSTKTLVLSWLHLKERINYTKV